jgi:hypothetical protein
MCVSVRLEGKIVNLYVHRVVAITLLPNPNNLPEVNHKDNNRTNNKVSNLEWCTDQYNQDCKKNFGTTPAEVQGCPVVAVNQETSEVFWFKTQSEAARQLSVPQSSISNVVKGKNNQTHDYYFCDADSSAMEKTREKFGNDIANKVEKLIREHHN